MTTPLEQIKERIENLKLVQSEGSMFSNGRYSTNRAPDQYNQAISDIQAILPSIIQEVEEATKRAVREDLMEHFGEVYNCPCGNEVSYFWGNLPSLKEESK